MNEPIIEEKIVLLAQHGYFSNLELRCFVLAILASLTKVKDESIIIERKAVLDDFLSSGSYFEVYQAWKLIEPEHRQLLPEVKHYLRTAL